jgi:hypothetical protein
MNRQTRLLISTILLAWSTLAVDAQLTISTNITWAKRETTNVYFADYIGIDYTVVGRVTSPNFDTNRTDMFIQDTNDGVGIQVLIDFASDTNALKVGVMASARGFIGQTNGMRYIKPTLSSRFSVTDPTVVAVVPRYSQVSNFLVQGEAYESSFVVVSNATFAFMNWPAWGGASASNRISDGTGEMGMYLNSDTDIGGQLAPTNAFTVKGILTQFDRDTNAPSGGYQIQPRYYADIMQSTAEQPPQIYIRGSNSVLGVGVNVETALELLGQDRNGSDTLTLSLKSGPTGAAVTDYGNRTGRFTWTPDNSFIGTTNTVTLEITDGTLTNTATIQISVRALSGGPGFAWINEFHYDNDSTDINEGVELAGPAGIDLSSYYILLYNGNGGVLYSPSNACSGIIDDEGNGYGAVWFPIAGMQNGPDGIALCHKTNGLLQFLSYGGSFIATAGPAAGLSAVDVGVFESTTEPIGLSLQLQGDGTNYEAFTWSGPMDATRGEINGAGQTINGAIPARVVYSGLSLSPAAPTTNMAFDIVSTVTPNYSASALVPTAWIRLSGGTWTSNSMTDQGGYNFKTDIQIPPQTNGTLVEYYISSTFDGPGSETSSPTVSATNSYLTQVFAPVMASLTNKITQVSNVLTFAVSATEVEGDMITLTASNLPANASFYPTNGTGAASGSFVFTPDASQVGVYTTAFYAADKDGVVFSNVVITVNYAGYFVNFEGVGETKSSYASGNVTLNGISWNMDEAVIGDLAADVKHGLRSARCRNAGTNMTMLTDKTGGCGAISLKYARYVTDNATSTGRVEYSTDAGVSWTQAGTNFVALSTNLADFATTLSVTGLVRMRIVRSSGSASRRMNIDDILMTDYSAPSGDVDGVPVAWWDRYGIPSGERLAAGNPDSDPDNNYEEYVADTDPTNSASYFVYEVTNMTGRGTLQLLVGPPTTNSRIYDAYYNTNLVTGPWTPYNFNVQGAADGSSFFLTVTNDAAGRFYRTGVKVP